MFADPAEEAAPKPRRGRRRGARRRWRGSLWAVPWIVFAIVIVAVGGVTFTAAMVALALHRAARAVPDDPGGAAVRPVAFVVAGGMIVAAHFGSARSMVLADRRRLPADVRVRAHAATRSRTSPTRWRSHCSRSPGSAFRFAHAVLLRDLPLHGAALLVDVLVATFVADTSAYARRPAVRPPPARPDALAQQDRRGPARRVHRRHDGLLVRRPLPGLARRRRRADDGRLHRRCSRRWATSSSR